ncbi:MAG: M2 family metallopeptidase [Chlamydiota bacterium]
MNATHPFSCFLDSFVPMVAKKSKQLNKAIWILETTGSQDAADLKTELDTELRLLFNDKDIYQNLLKWDQDPTLQAPLLKRQLNVLIRSFKQYCIPKDLLEEIAKQETVLLHTYANFRPTLEGRTLSENDIRTLLKEENDPIQRQKTWEASKQIGDLLSPLILPLVRLRNLAAKSVGYTDYFHMQLDLQEIDPSWLFSLLDEYYALSEEIYDKTIKEIEKDQCKRFSVTPNLLGPWAWSEPFSQEDPIDSRELDSLTEGADLCSMATGFYQKMGLDILPTLDVSDLYEKDGKNQHAFCINIDREKDVRTLNNIKPTLKWAETILHELGHAIYELGFTPDTPWLLKEPPHMISTEAMALIAGRQAYLPEVLNSLQRSSENHDILVQKAKKSLARRQLIFSRFVLVMTYFERELYKNPEQDLQALWWSMVYKYQKILPPKEHTGKNDWAAKYHIGLAPVYYYSYLLGEMLASSIEETLLQETGNSSIASKEAGKLLQERLFSKANTLPLESLVSHVTKKPLSAHAWIKQYAI